jgi:hypothetical protein
MLPKNDLTDVIMEPRVNRSNLKLQSLTEEATLRFEKYLGTDDADALILGCVVVPKMYNAEVQNTVREFASMAFGEDVKFELYPIHPHDSLPKHIKPKMDPIRKHVNYLYCLIYLPPFS